MDTLVAAQILTVERPYGFVHPLVQGAIHDGLPPAGRAEAHARAARLTAQAGAPPGRVAAHLLAADPARDDWAIQMLRAAAREASVNGAPASAASYLQRALRESPERALRSELLLELGQVQLHAGIPGAAEHIRATLELQDDPRHRAEICLKLGHALVYTGDCAAGRDAFSEGLAQLDDTEDDLFQIAQALFINPNTVATHLTHTYQKLDIQSRAQLLNALTSPASATHQATPSH